MGSAIVARTIHPSEDDAGATPPFRHAQDPREAGGGRHPAAEALTEGEAEDAHGPGGRKPWNTHPVSMDWSEPLVGPLDREASEGGGSWVDGWLL